ncbi:MAG: DUF924 family protein [Pseudomonadota bacterium]
MDDAQTIISFWVDEVGPQGWYKVDPALDSAIRERFMDDWEKARSGAYDRWMGCPKSILALLILLDQFPRNMFRDDARAFSTDRHALRVAMRAIAAGFDRRVAEPQRQFFYLPLMHSELLPDQDRCVRMMMTRMPETGAPNLLHARAHREVIRRFGRFPTRNAALGRVNSREEAAFLAEGGYGRVTRELEEAA